MKLGNPNLKVLAFQGDGGAYSEGMEHFIHAFRYNADLTLIVHDNQAFSLTTGQTTPTTQKGEVTKSMPLGEVNFPLNPIKIALACGATFVARCNPYDIQNTSRIIQSAIKHKGFSYIEMMQKCLIFNTEMNDLDKIMYNISDCHNLERAEKFASEWDYNSKTGKIPIGIIYQSEKGEQSLEEKWPQLKSLLDQKKSWR
jgi:2-oxoglutarate/2-oxoacid ferredoxin oxidoreductase subunit beta